MDKVKKAGWWLVSSSADPNEVSATIKGLAAFIPAVLAATQLLGLDGLAFADLDALLDSLAGLAVGMIALISGAYAAFGLARKVWVNILKIYTAIA